MWLIWKYKEHNKNIESGPGWPFVGWDLKHAPPERKAGSYHVNSRSGSCHITFKLVKHEHKYQKNFSQILILNYK